VAAGLIGASLPPGVEQRVTLCQPAPAALPADGLARFGELLNTHRLPARSLAFQAGAFAMAQVLEEAMKRAGARLTRAAFVGALESLRDFKTGVAPPLSFGANRRIAIRGAVLTRYDPEQGRRVPVGDWIEIEPD
jgi:hypothetical protein